MISMNKERYTNYLCSRSDISVLFLRILLWLRTPLHTMFSKNLFFQILKIPWQCYGTGCKARLLVLLFSKEHFCYLMQETLLVHRISSRPRY